MKLGIMQPYLFPYIGYFQLLNLVDKFILHDDIQWIKGGWINRNRILTNNKDKMITLSVTKRSSYDSISQFEFSQDKNNHKKFLNQISSSYLKSPYFKSVFPLIERIVLNKEINLTQYIKYSIEEINSYLKIKTPIFLSSNLAKNNDLKAQDRVIEICKAIKADTYINPIGGTELYNKDVFLSHGIKLYFINTNKILYKQYDNNFIPNLSIIDIVMFNSRETISKMLNEFKLI
jgi:hypothetical protein